MLKIFFLININKMVHFIIMHFIPLPNYNNFLLLYSFICIFTIYIFNTFISDTFKRSVESRQKYWHRNIKMLWRNFWKHSFLSGIYKFNTIMCLWIHFHRLDGRTYRCHRDGNGVQGIYCTRNITLVHIRFVTVTVYGVFT